METVDTAEELNQLSIDFEALTCDLTQLSPEQVRSDMAVEHRDIILNIKKLHKEIGKMIREHDQAAIKLKSFF